MVKADRIAPAIVSCGCHSGINNKIPLTKKINLKATPTGLKKKPPRPMVKRNVAKVAITKETRMPVAAPSIIKLLLKTKMKGIMYIMKANLTACHPVFTQFDLAMPLATKTLGQTGGVIPDMQAKYNMNI